MGEIINNLRKKAEKLFNLNKFDEIIVLPTYQALEIGKSYRSLLIQSV